MTPDLSIAKDFFAQATSLERQLLEVQKLLTTRLGVIRRGGQGDASKRQLQDGALVLRVKLLEILSKDCF